jgi:hypothetical protein
VLTYLSNGQISAFLEYERALHVDDHDCRPCWHGAMSLLKPFVFESVGVDTHWNVLISVVCMYVYMCICMYVCMYVCVL